MTDKKLEARVAETVCKPMTAILTYRGVDGFYPMVYVGKEGRDLLVKQHLRKEEREEFLWRLETPAELLERVDQAFVYYGAVRHGFEKSEEDALERHLQHCLGKDYRTRGIKVALVSCGCCAGEIKEKAAESLGFPFMAGLRSDRQATKVMGEIARAVLHGESYELIVSRFKYDPVADFDPQI